MRFLPNRGSEEVTFDTRRKMPTHSPAGPDGYVVYVLQDPMDFEI